MPHNLARWWTALALAALALLATPALAQTFPKFTGLVVDDANVIPPDREAALVQKLEAFQQQTGRQLVVATIADTQGHPVEDYGYRLGREWAVGLKDVNNGVILFVAPNQPAGQRGPRIEVGYGLEPVLTDAMSSVIIRTRMIPLLRPGNDIPGALEAGADAIIQQLSMPDEEAKAAQAKAIAEFDAAQKQSPRRSGGGGIPLGLIFWGLVAAFVFLSMRRGRHSKAMGGGKRYRRRGGDDWPVWLWVASEIASSAAQSRGGGGGLFGGDGGGGGGGWGGGGFTGGGGGSFGGGGASGDW